MPLTPKRQLVPAWKGVEIVDLVEFRSRALFDSGVKGSEPGEVPTVARMLRHVGRMAGTPLKQGPFEHTCVPIQKSPLQAVLGDPNPCKADTSFEEPGQVGRHVNELREDTQHVFDDLCYCYILVVVRQIRVAFI